MRGKDRISLLAFQSLRITPAYAGKSREMTHENLIAEDHPRVCGEKTKKIP